MASLRRAAAFLLVCVLAVAACTGDDEAAKVRAAALEYRAALADKDAVKACGLSTDALKHAIEQAGRPCEELMAMQLRLARPFTRDVKIVSVKVTGRTATVTMKSPEATSLVTDEWSKLDGSWKLFAPGAPPKR